MSGLNQDLMQRLRDAIREFEDRKITAADLSRAVFHAAREIEASGEESRLRRALERHGNRVASLGEESLSGSKHPQILKIVDALEAELVEWGY